MSTARPVATRPFAILVALACWSTVATAQVAGIQHPGASKGFDPQPDPPGKQLPVRQLAGSLRIAAAADVTYKNGIMIGQTFAPWGTMVTVSDSQAYSMERGRCAFRIRYGMTNLTSAATPATFKNTLAADAAIVSTNDMLLLNGLQSKEVDTHAWLPIGTYNLILRLDAGNTVPETNEGNNVVRVRLTLNGTCQKPAGVNLPKVPGEEKAHVPFVPPGTPNTADQTDEKPAPHTRGGYQTPDTKGQSSAIINRRPMLNRGLGAAAAASQPGH